MFSNDLLPQQYDVRNTDDTNKIDIKNNERKKRDFWQTMGQAYQMGANNYYQSTQNQIRLGTNIAHTVNNKCVNQNLAKNTALGAVGGALAGLSGGISGAIAGGATGGAAGAVQYCGDKLI